MMSAKDQTHIDFIIVIPCYNEAARFTATLDQYTRFLKEQPLVGLCLVDDGSTDKTVSFFQKLKMEFPNQIESLVLGKNQGKAEAVRAGINHCLTHFDANYLAYLDADLATSFSECLRVYSLAKSNPKIDFAFGSRILKVGSEIKRKKFRFVVGRIIATFISSILKLKVYDTQCGCKVVERELAGRLFKDPFISKWLFDVELFFRMIQCFGRKGAIEKMMEVPLQQWIDMGDSKVPMSYIFKLWLDLYKIKRSYAQLKSPKNDLAKNDA